MNGDFSCTDTKIATLKNCPEYVGGDFYCIDCYNLTSLEGAPKEVGGSFYCYACDNLTSLEGAPKEVGGDFYCIDCYNLTSLEGAPKEVGGNFYLKCVCGIPAKKFTEEDVKKVCNVKGKICVSH